MSDLAASIAREADAQGRARQTARSCGTVVRTIGSARVARSPQPGAEPCLRCGVRSDVGCRHRRADGDLPTPAVWTPDRARGHGPGRPLRREAQLLAILTGAADRGEPCPSNPELAAMIGSASASLPVAALSRMANRGEIIVERFQNARRVTIVATGKATRLDGEHQPHWRDRGRA